METLGDAYPKEQERLRHLLVEAEKMRSMPGVNMTFYIAMLNDLLQRADKAAIEQDTVAMVGIYKEMQEFEA